jgi:hypothetical protein
LSNTGSPCNPDSPGVYKHVFAGYASGEPIRTNFLSRG